MWYVPIRTGITHTRICRCSTSATFIFVSYHSLCLSIFFLIYMVCIHIFHFFSCNKHNHHHFSYNSVDKFCIFQKNFHLPFMRLSILSVLLRLFLLWKNTCNLSYLSFLSHILQVLLQTFSLLMHT